MALLFIDLCWWHTDISVSSEINIIQKLRKPVAILKLHNGNSITLIDTKDYTYSVNSNGIVLIDIKDYTNYVRLLFKVPKKSQIPDTGPPITWLKP